MSTPYNNRPVPLFPTQFSSEKKPKSLPPKTPSKTSSVAKKDNRKYSISIDSILLEHGFKLPHKIGSGSYGDVYSCERNNEKLAVKVYQKNERKLHLKKEARYEYQQNRNLFANSHTPCHPNVLRYYSMWEDDRCIFIESELCSRSLRDELNGGSFEKEKEMTRDEAIAESIWDIAMGLHFIHSQGFVHLDVKAENVLVGLDGKLKICDFGTMTPCGRCRTDISGTHVYSAPELQGLHRIDQEDEWTESNYVAPAADVFSLGLVLFEMLTSIDISALPAQANYFRTGIATVRDFGAADSDLARLCSLMMNADPSLRISIDDIFRHPALSSVRAKKLEHGDIFDSEWTHTFPLSLLNHRRTFSNSSLDTIPQSSGKEEDDNESLSSHNVSFEEEDEYELLVAPGKKQRVDKPFSPMWVASLEYREMQRRDSFEVGEEKKEIPPVLQPQPQLKLTDLSPLPLESTQAASGFARKALFRM